LVSNRYSFPFYPDKELFTEKKKKKMMMMMMD